jgi:hypothetical protein
MGQLYGWYQQMGRDAGCLGRIFIQLSEVGATVQAEEADN